MADKMLSSSGSAAKTPAPALFEMIPGRFPLAVWRGETGPRDVTLWSTSGVPYMHDDVDGFSSPAGDTETLRRQLCAAHIPCAEYGEGIVAVVVGDPFVCESIQEDLLEIFDIYVIAEPHEESGARLLLTPTVLHSSHHIAQLVTALGTLWDTNALNA